MAQQSKITSRPLTKALGTASILGMAIAGANFANALQTDFGVTYQADAFAISSDAYEDAGASSSTDNGFANLLRVKADFKDENTGISIHTSTELASDRWSGDGKSLPSGTASSESYTGNANEDVTLDLGYVQVPFSNGTILRVGRQAANWSNCFLTCDDRRDRILTLTPTSLGTVIALYDRRSDTASFANRDNGDQVALGLVTKAADFNVGLLYVHWLQNTATPGGYPLQGTHLFSPYISGMIGDAVKLDVGVNYFDGNEVDLGDGRIYADASFGTYVRGGFDLGAMNLQVQWAGTQDGGFIVPGFDTFSSLINNNPDSTQNPTSLYRMGGQSGLEDHEENLFIAKATFDVTPRMSLHGSVGTLQIDNGTDDDDSMIYDLGASYKLNESVTTSATWGMVTENDVATTTGNGLVPAAGGVAFADDDLMAAKVSLNVAF
ncbi:hypothetical protein [Marinobacter sp. AN1]|jgi:hypothetical protein|uniref:hypothetical protein n=1 Tax=Marinobacter sp. AN1 TaxID=2886046 RepID=UPI00223215F9|nr:hypothetical protein [Marinobacter sp. AN1]UZD66093.1 hypothetical protein LJ360_01610 [Marinobacter sp. AN1]